MTLLIRLAAPLQSWGGDSKFNTRRTERAPTKSGVAGLCACAMGVKRTDTGSLARLASLRFGVRTDKTGERLTDFQTARNEKTSFISHRDYLADAAFTAGLEGDEGLLREIDAALRSPVYPLFLGRRGCPPTLPLSLGIVDMPLEDALKSAMRERFEGEELIDGRWLDGLRRRLAKGNHGEILVDASGLTPLRRRDMPLSFSQERREYAFRSVEQIVGGDGPLIGGYGPLIGGDDYFEAVEED
jgi:CRISPR system Cascade subunit CasD